MKTLFAFAVVLLFAGCASVSANAVGEVAASPEAAPVETVASSPDADVAADPEAVPAQEPE